MDWPTAAVLISAIVSALISYIASLYFPREFENTEAIGFHVDELRAKDDEEE